jgi:hypothetical protein
VTNAATAPVMSFAATQLDWEDFGANDIDFQDRHSREYIQAESVGRQFGTVPFVLPQIPGGNATLPRNLAGVILAHEIRLGASIPNQIYTDLSGKMEAFGYGGATTVYNYWNTGYPIDITPANATASLVVSKTGSAIILVTDWAAGGNYSITMSAENRMKLGLTGTLVVQDIERRSTTLSVNAAGVIGFNLAKHDFIAIQVDSL